MVMGKNKQNITKENNTNKQMTRRFDNERLAK